MLWFNSQEMLLLFILHHIKKQPPDVFCIKGVFKKYLKIYKKHLWQSLIFKKEALAQVFSCEFWEILRTPFLQNTSGWLLLHIVVISLTKGTPLSMKPVVKHSWRIIMQNVPYWKNMCHTYLCLVSNHSKV